MDIPFGAIVLTDFPFTDLSAAKRRPALVISRDNERRSDVVVAYISSVMRDEPDAMPIQPSPENGLKVPSLVRFDKIATLERRIVAGRLGGPPTRCGWSGAEPYSSAYSASARPSYSYSAAVFFFASSAKCF